MKKAEYLAFARKKCEELLAVIEAKNNDYTAGSSSAFANFESTPELASPLAGLLIRMGDKFQRLKTFSQTGKLSVQNEGAEDAFKDLMGYALIGLGMLSEMPATQQTRSSSVDREVELIASLRAEQVKPDGPKVFTIQEGKRYRCRDGVVTTPVERVTPSPDGDFRPFFAVRAGKEELGWYYDEQGKCFPEGPFYADLVEEVK